MSKYIDADRLMAILAKRCDEAENQEAWFAYARACGDVRDLPAADVQEVKHGRWMRPWPARKKSYVRICSECGELCWYCGAGDYSYCPWCGAKMDEVEDGNPEHK